MNRLFSDSRFITSIVVVQMVATLILILLVLLLNSHVKGITYSFQGGSGGVDSQEIRDALTEVQTKLDQDDLQGAYDYLLAAMRIAPLNPDVFTVTLNFVERANNSGETMLADDIFARAEILISYQKVTEIASARKQWDSIENALETPDTEPQQIDWLADVDVKLVTIKDKNISNEVRANLARLARDEISELRIQLALGQLTSAPDNLLVRADAIEGELNHQEFLILTSMFKETQSNASLWMDKISSDLLQAAREFPGTEVEVTTPKVIKETEVKSEAITKQLGDAIVACSKFISENNLYVGAEIAVASDFNKRLLAFMDDLIRAKSWIYNMRAINRITWVRDKRLHDRGNSNPLEMLGHLAQIYENQLDTYSRKVLIDEWNHWFEDLEEPDKVQAMKIRILRNMVQ